jgi:hypothetical protein
MRIPVYLLALAPLVFASCETEPTTVTTTTTTQEVTTTGPAREVVVAGLRPPFGLKPKPWRRGRDMSGHVVFGDGPEPITYGAPAVGWCDQGRPLCG